MTPQEQQLLEDFLARLRSASGVAKDPQADALIHARLADQPDAAYLLVQRSLLLEHALEAAKAQIAQLQQATPPPPPATSFLGQGFNAAPPPLPSAPAPAAPGWRERLFGGGAATPEPAPAPAAARGPSFLSTAATTAAGVAGGMFLFEGVESLLGGRHGGFFGGGGGGQQEVVVENVTNNYYDAPMQDDQDVSQDYQDDTDTGGDDWV
ncbi:DUF2076 family protein [Xanthomonas sp. GPE 39]|uniref:DUF2076 family protein n=1 Tax=Xanthomonas sp. GPE 39 TaxID=1583099 RepID=UPI0005F2C3DD|nr:DUF2076 family protein [Xanthomonas sp. GPE 39]